MAPSEKLGFCTRLGLQMWVRPASSGFRPVGSISILSEAGEVHFNNAALVSVSCHGLTDVWTPKGL